MSIVSRHTRVVDLFARHHWLTQLRLTQFSSHTSAAASITSNEEQNEQQNKKRDTTNKLTNNLYAALAVSLAAGALLFKTANTDKCKTNEETAFLSLSDIMHEFAYPFADTMQSLVTSSFERLTTMKTLKAKEAESVQNEVCRLILERINFIYKFF
jgi:hypothetical protein